MQDIRKPYTHSKYNQSISSKVKNFEASSYSHKEDDEPVNIPTSRGTRVRRNLDHMEMYPRREKVNDEEENGGRAYPDISYRNPRTIYKKNRNSFGTWAFIITIAVLVVVIGLLTYIFNRATVTIVPKYVDIDNLNKTINFTNNATSTNGSVPFIIATSSLSKSKTLQLSDSQKVEAKASGKIVIYNNYDSNTQKLIKSTRFESSSGKIYRINQSIEVPGKKGDTPGSVEVTVYADSYGADYNTDPTDFTIPGFKGTPRYKGFFARSNGPITGGSSGNISVPSLSDINAAKDELAIELAQEVKANLIKIKKDGYTGLYSASEIIYEDNQIEVLQGKTAIYKMTATGYLMLADSLVLAHTVALGVRDYANEPVHLTYEDTLSYTKKDIDHIANSDTLTILVEGSPRVVWISDKEGIKKMVIGKNRNEFKPLMKTIDSIESASISFSPLWLSSFPDDINKVSIIESLPKR
jgi:hypothetical protein